MRKRASKDDNHDTVALAFQRVGAAVIHTHMFGQGFPDMLVCFRGRVYMIEVKNPQSVYGRKGLNELQQRLRNEGWPLCVVRTEDDAMQLILKREDGTTAERLPID